MFSKPFGLFSDVQNQFEFGLKMFQLRVPTGLNFKLCWFGYQEQRVSFSFTEAQMWVLIWNLKAGVMAPEGTGMSQECHRKKSGPDSDIK